MSVQQPLRVNNKYTNLSSVLSAATGIEQKHLESYHAAQASIRATEEWLTSAIQDCKNKMVRSSMANKAIKDATISFPEAAQSVTQEGSKSIVVSFSSSNEVGGTVEDFIFPEETLDYVHSLRVKDIRDELRNRGLDETGLKKELRARLLADIKREYCQQNESSSSKSDHTESSYERKTSIIDSEENRSNIKPLGSTNSSTTDISAVATSISIACSSKGVGAEKVNKGLSPVYEMLTPEQQLSPVESSSEIVTASVPIVTAETQTTKVEEIDGSSSMEEVGNQDINSENGSSQGETADKNHEVEKDAMEVENDNGGVERAASAKDGQQTVNDDVVMMDTSDSSNSKANEESEAKSSTKKDTHGQSYTKEGTENHPIQADQATDNTSARKNSVASSPGRSSSSSDRKRLRSPMRTLVKSAVKKFSPAHKVARLAAKLEKTTLENTVSAKQVITGAEQKISGPESTKAIFENALLSSNMLVDKVPALENEVMPPPSQKSIAPESQSTLKATLADSCHQTACTQPQRAQEQDVRKAKIAEMREKSKAVVGGLKPLGSTSNFMQSLHNQGEVDGKKKTLAHKMREKALKNQATNAQSSTATLKNQATNAQSSTATLARTFESPKLPMLGSTSASKFGSAAAASKVKYIFATTSAFQSGVFSPGKVAPAPQAQKPPTPPPPDSPMSTYEMSDYDSECDSDDESTTSNRRDKNVPSWAQRQNLLAALNVQFKNPNLDPDEIFGEILTCDLQAIFNKKKQRYQRRTSSGCWTKDKATAHEKLAYKRSIKNQVVSNR